MQSRPADTQTEIGYRQNSHGYGQKDAAARQYGKPFICRKTKRSYIAYREPCLSFNRQPSPEALSADRARNLIESEIKGQVTQVTIARKPLRHGKTPFHAGTVFCLHHNVRLCNRAIRGKDGCQSSIFPMIFSDRPVPSWGQCASQGKKTANVPAFISRRAPISGSSACLASTAASGSDQV